MSSNNEFFTSTSDSAIECQITTVIQNFLDDVIKQIECDNELPSFEKKPTKRTNDDDVDEVCSSKVMKLTPVSELSSYSNQKKIIPDTIHPDIDKIKEILRSVNCEYIDINESPDKYELDLNRLIINKSKNSYLGLEYFIEFQIKPNKKEKIVAPKYYCSLCAQALIGNYKQFIINHLRSEQHVLKYLSLTCPQEYKRLISIGMPYVRLDEIDKLNYKKIYGLSLTHKQALLVYLSNLDEDFLKCCEKLNQECRKIEIDLIQNEIKSRPFFNASFQIPSNLVTDNDYISSDHSEEYADVITEDCEESEVEDFVKEKSLTNGTLLRLQHLRKLKTSVKTKTNIEILTDSINYMINKIDSEDDKLKFLNDILKTVVQTVHVKRLNNSLQRINYRNFEKSKVESLIEELISGVKTTALSAHEIRSIRVYIEKNRDSIELSKLKSMAVKLKEIMIKQKV